ncbi:MAG: hypothetical protein AAB937_00545 [Patescibacteria group bacterium]
MIKTKETFKTTSYGKAFSEAYRKKMEDGISPFEALFLTYYNDVKNRLLMLGAQVEQVDDLAQDTFLQIVKAAKNKNLNPDVSVATIRHPRTYLYKAAKTALLRHVEKQNYKKRQTDKHLVELSSDDERIDHLISLQAKQAPSIEKQIIDSNVVRDTQKNISQHLSQKQKEAMGILLSLPDPLVNKHSNKRTPLLNKHISEARRKLRKLAKEDEVIID